MPIRPPSVASVARRARDAEYERTRRDPAAAAVYRSRRWRSVRAAILRSEPLCRPCARAGRTTLASQVDHIVGLRRAPGLAFAPSNLQPICTACHAAKTAQESRSERCGAIRPPVTVEGGRAISYEEGRVERAPELAKIRKGFENG